MSLGGTQALPNLIYNTTCMAKNPCPLDEGFGCAKLFYDAGYDDLQGGSVGRNT